MKLIPGKLYRVIKSFRAMPVEAYVKGQIDYNDIIFANDEIVMFVEKREDPHPKMACCKWMHIFLMKGPELICSTESAGRDSLDKRPEKYLEIIETK